MSVTRRIFDDCDTIGDRGTVDSDHGTVNGDRGTVDGDRETVDCVADGVTLSLECAIVYA